MAIYYADNVSGNDANDGSTEGLAKANPALFFPLASGDILRIKATGVTYNITTPTATNQTLGTACMITNWVGDGLARYTLYFKRGAGNFNWNIVTSAVIANGDLICDLLTNTTGNSPLTFAGALAMNNCSHKIQRTGGSLSNAGGLAISLGTNGTFNNVEFSGDLSMRYVLTPANKALFTNCIFHDFFTHNALVGLVNSSNAAANRCLFYDISFWQFNASTTRNILIGTQWQQFINNTIITKSETISTNTANPHYIIAVSSIAGLTGQYMNNVIYDQWSGGSAKYAFGYEGSTAKSAEDFFMIGANAINMTESNIPNYSADLSATETLSGSPFLSLTPGDADFAKIDTSSADGLLLKGGAFNEPYIDIGRYQTTPTGGATPNAYDLRAGVTVGAVTGTLVVPAVADVRIGVNYDVAPNAKTGVLNLPIEADVRNGITYDNATKTGTYLAYPLLNLDQVKIGVDRGDGSVGTYTAIERYSDLDLSQIVNGYAYRYNSLTNNRSGTRTSVYALLPLNKVAIGYDRGDTQLGTYDAVERYTDLVLSNVKASYNFRYNSLTDNRTGTHVEAVSTDPGEANVRDGINYIINDVNKTGSYVAYPLLPAERVQFNYDRGDGTFGTDKGELFNDALIASELKIGVSKQNIGNTIVGTYNASERYTFIPEDKVEINFDYLYNNEEFTGSFAGGGATDYPLEEKVLFPTVYAFGLKTGTLGKYNTTNLDIAKQLQTNAELVLTNVLGSEFTALKYFKEVEKNDFYSITKQYGIRPKDIVMLKDVIGKDTADITFEIKLTTDFDNRDADDAERLAELYLIEKMEAIRRQLRVTKFGSFSKVRIIRDFNQLECEKVGDRVILCRAEITVSFSAE